ncbi:hypothetical protein BN14_10191 [Rhizoctonia solani AG-1 IB]|nr:hypothetical protein BN14_10191 [Rhizoctonia solani AG-1 IB]
MLNAELGYGVKGIIYVHYATDPLQSRSLTENLNVLFNVLLGQPVLRHLVILVVPSRSSGIVHATSIAADIQAPGSTFCVAHTAGARVMVSRLGAEDVFDVLRDFVTNDFIQAKAQCDRPTNVRHAIEQALGYCDISSVNAAVLRQKEATTQEYRPSLLAAKEELGTTRLALAQTQRVLADTKDKSDRYQAGYRQLEVQIGGEQKRSQELSRKLQETQAEYSSLRSQLQLQDNIEQSEVMLGLKDINQAIEDIGRTFSARFVDQYANAAFSKDVLEVTTLDARDPMALRVVFDHREGEPSFIKSSSGAGMMVEDFFDYGIRHLLCSFLWQRIFSRFHPRLDDPLDQLLIHIYKDVQRREPQTMSGKWRLNAFIGIDSNNAEGQAEDTGAAIASHTKQFCGGIVALARAFFGQNQDIQLEESHYSQADKLMHMAWEWNAKLKGKVIVLGDFYQTCYEPRLPLDPDLMEEFSPRKDINAGKILGTIGLGLTSLRAVGGGQPAEKTVICKAVVATESLYE